MGLDQQFFRVYGEDENDREEVAYFRKVNWLHGWVQQHLNDGEEHNCEDIPMHLEAIAGLAQTCEMVLLEPRFAPEFLPCQGGFFFGSYDYDECYFESVHDVRAACLRIMDMAAHENPPGSSRWVYWSWW
jgi:hypothetical protein